MDYDQLRIAIIANAIVRQTFDKIARESDPPNESDMDRFIEEAEAIAGLAIERWVDDK